MMILIIPLIEMKLNKDQIIVAIHNHKNDKVPMNKVNIEYLAVQDQNIINFRIRNGS